MDSRFLKNTILVSLLFMITIFLVVLYANGFGPGQKQVSEPAAVEKTTEVLHGQIGDDLYGWMADDQFFEKEEEEKEEEGGESLSLIATSVEKDLRIQIVDEAGETVKGQFFKILLNGTDEYRDLDKDGVIYIGEMDAGTYQVKLAETAGYRVPPGVLPVKVRSRVEYAPIGDISLLIKTEQEVDALAEDGERAKPEDGLLETAPIRTVSNAAFGIDVSRWNEQIDWKKVKEAGVEFAIIRVGYRGSVSGSLVEDAYFKQNIQGAAEAGIPVGVYFFTQAIDQVEAVEEASMVLELCKDYQLTYPIFIDTEGAGGDGRADHLDVRTRTAVCEAFCETIRNSGHKGGVYASRNWFNQQLDPSRFPDDIVIWLAEYADAPSYEGNYHLWQYSSSGRILGIEGRVDMNLSYLTLEENDTDGDTAQIP